MSLFRIVKYSSILFFLGKYKVKLFRTVAIGLFAAVTSLLYQDVAAYLQQQHPGVVIYALIAKILIVYGAFAFVLWQFRPEREPKSGGVNLDQAVDSATATSVEEKTTAPTGPLAGLEDVSQKDHLRTRYEGVLKGPRDSS